MILAIDLVKTHGGGQQVLVDVVHVASRAGAKVVAIVAAQGWIEKALGDKLGHVAVRAPARQRTGFFWRALRFLQISTILFRCRALFRDSTLIVVNDPEAFLPAVVVASMSGGRLILYLHMAYSGLAARVVGLAARSARVWRLVCVSEYVREHTVRIVPESAAAKLTVVENALPQGTEADTADYPPGDLGRIAVVGRLHPDKGQDIVCCLSRRFPGAVFYLIGPFENSDQDYVQRVRVGSAGNVRFVGYRHPVIPYLRSEAIGIVLVPSRIPEAFALVPLEAAVAGCVVIARDIGGLGEVARKAGLTVVQSDEQFATEIAAVQALGEERLRELTKAARQRALRHYHPDRFATRLRELLAL